MLSGSDPAKKFRYCPHASFRDLISPCISFPSCLRASIFISSTDLVKMMKGRFPPHPPDLISCQGSSHFAFPHHVNLQRAANAFYLDWTSFLLFPWFHLQTSAVGWFHAWSVRPANWLNVYLLCFRGINPAGFGGPEAQIAALLRHPAVIKLLAGCLRCIKEAATHSQERLWLVPGLSHTHAQQLRTARPGPAWHCRLPGQPRTHMYTKERPHRESGSSAPLAG